MQLDEFGNHFQQIFNDQFGHVLIGLAGYATKVHQMHISKNSYIKPRLDMYDIETYFISWFTRENPKGGSFGLF
jgi:hypothetical protein